MAIRLLIVDDHDIVRQGLRTFLGQDPAIEIVGEAADGRQALEQARQLHPDVVLMDLLMPEMDGLECTAAIRSALPHTEVLALTSIVGEELALEAYRAGAIGVMLKSAKLPELREAVKAAAAGQAQIPQAYASRLVRSVGPATSAGKSVNSLTEREVEVLRWLARGKSNKEMAVSLQVSEATIKSHVSSILRKLGVDSRTQAATYAVQQGMVPAISGDSKPRKR